MLAPTLPRRLLIVPLALCAVLAGGAVGRVQDVCGPFTDVSAALCPYVLEVYALGISAGTSPTTYSPDAPLTRGQAAVFVSKGVNQAIARSTRRAALGQWWTTTPRWNAGLGVTPILRLSGQIAADGADIWAPSSDNSISRVRASDGRLLETWTGADGPVLAAMGRIFSTKGAPAALYAIDPAAPPGAATLVAANIGPNFVGSLAFDGSRIWATECCALTIPGVPPPPGAVSIITPGTWSVTTITEGFTAPWGITFDGDHMWVTDRGASALFELDANGAILRTIPLGYAGKPTFDGANLWVPVGGSVLVVRAATGEIVATLETQIAGYEEIAVFDGSRVLVIDGPYINVFDAASLTPIAVVETGFNLAVGAASDGVNTWFAMDAPGSASFLGRF